MLYIKYPNRDIDEDEIAEGNFSLDQLKRIVESLDEHVVILSENRLMIAAYWPDNPEPTWVYLH